MLSRIGNILNIGSPGIGISAPEIDTDGTYLYFLQYSSPTVYLRAYSIGTTYNLIASYSNPLPIASYAPSSNFYVRCAGGLVYVSSGSSGGNPVIGVAKFFFNGSNFTNISTWSSTAGVYSGALLSKGICVNSTYVATVIQESTPATWKIKLISTSSMALMASYSLGASVPNSNIVIDNSNSIYFGGNVYVYNGTATLQLVGATPQTVVDVDTVRNHIFFPTSSSAYGSPTIPAGTIIRYKSSTNDTIAVETNKVDLYSYNGGAFGIIDYNDPIGNPLTIVNGFHNGSYYHLLKSNGDIAAYQTSVTANFSGFPTSGYKNLSVLFSDLSTGLPDTWSWNFGDGTSSTFQNFNHTYITPGTYTVALTARKGAGTPSTLTKSSYITVSNATIDFTSNTQTSFCNLNINFKDLSSPAPLTWAWTFGDGGTSTQQNPSYAYALPGTYTVTLSTTNNYSSLTTTKTSYITIKPLSLAYQQRFYVANTPSSFNDPNSWSYTSGGAGGAPVPDYTTTAVFNRAGAGLCTISSPINVGGILAAFPYDGTVNQNHSDMTVGGDGFYAGAGQFNGQGKIAVYGPLYISNQVFNSPDFLEIHGQSSFYAGFLPSDNTVNAYGGCQIVGGSNFFNALQIKDNLSLPAQFDGTSTITNLYLTSGSFYQTRPTIMHLKGDLTCSSTFGSVSPYNNAQILIDGTGIQRFYSDGVLPSVKFNRSDSTTVVLQSSNDTIYLSGDFILQDGTVQTNGLNIQAGF
jgi:PKD repeat protein